MNPSTSIVIVGGGIVGLATAWQLQKEQPSIQITLLEKEQQLAQHQTGHNSGVLHSGVYYKPGSLKAITTREGRQAMIEFCQQRDITLELCGKVIVATSPEEIPRLDELTRKAEANGVDAHRIGPSELAEIEPNAAGIDALRVPDAGIVDFVGVSMALASDLVDGGATIRTGAQVTGLTETGAEVIVDLAGGEQLRADLVVTCGGLHSDRLARSVQPDLAERIIPFRGEYYELEPAARKLVNHLIYPVPDPQFPFLGVHLTRMIDGSIHAGPNAVLALAREGYRWRDINLKDLAEVARFPGTWKLGKRHWRMGAGEYRRSLSKSAFVDALRRLMPAIDESMLIDSPAGVRAQAIAPNGDLLDDFVWSETKRVVSVINAPSPAATASLAIGQRISERAISHL